MVATFRTANFQRSGIIQAAKSRKMAALLQLMGAIGKLPPLTLEGFKKYRSRAEGRRNNGV
jgi:hypothetical protein